MSNLNVSIDIDKLNILCNKPKIERDIIIKKMLFIHNALEDGWNVKLRNNSYIFSKKHENKREIFQDSYLQDFIVKNFNS